MLETEVVERFDGETQAEGSMRGLTRLRLAGPITAATSPGVRQALHDSARRSGFKLLVDLQDVTALDASGVAALLQGRREIDGHPDGVFMLRPNGLVMRALRTTRTLTVFNVWTG